MAAKMATKVFGVDPKAKSHHYPDDLSTRASAAISPLDPYYEEDPTVKEWLLESRPTAAGTVRYLKSLFPFVQWIGNYNTRWLVGDAIGGLTLGLVVVPQALSYSMLAGLRPEYGLYTSFIGASLYWLFGTSKDIAIGATAVVSLLVGRIIETAVTEHPEFAPEQVSKTIAVLAGCFLLLFGLLRLDWLIEFIPHVAIAAFVTGASITITLSQMPTVLGITGINTREAPYAVFIETCKALPRVTIGAAVGLTALFLLQMIKWFCGHMVQRQKHRTRMWETISSMRMTFVILMYTLISFLVNRGLPQEAAKFKILGTVPTGFQAAGVPSFDLELIKVVAPELPALLIILIIEHIAIAKSFARLNNYVVMPSQEIISIGAANLIGPFLGGYPATGSFTGTAVLSKAGVRTPMAGLFNGLILLLALYALTSVFYFIPLPALAALIVHAVSNLITPPETVFKYWQLAPLDVFIYFSGVFISVFLSLEDGIYVTVALSFVILLLRIARSQGRFLGRVRLQEHSESSNGSGLRGLEQLDGADHRFGGRTMAGGREVFLPLDRHDGSNPAVDVSSVYPGVFIYRFAEGCNYLNQAQAMDHILEHIREHTRKTNPDDYECPGDRPWNEPKTKKASMESVVSSDYGTMTTPQALPLLRAVVCDFSSVNQIDTTSIEGLMDMRAQLDRWAAPAAVEWHFSGVRSRWTRRALVTAGFGYPSAITSGGFWLPAFDIGATTPARSKVESDGGRRQRPRSLASTLRVDHSEEDVADTMVHKSPSGDAAVDPESGIGSGALASGTLTPGSMVANLREIQGCEVDAVSRETHAPVYGVDRPFFHADLVSAVGNAVESARWRDKIGAADGAVVRDTLGNV